MLLVPTQSQIRIMKIPVNGTPEFVRLSVTKQDRADIQRTRCNSGNTC